MNFKNSKKQNSYINIALKLNLFLFLTNTIRKSLLFQINFIHNSYVVYFKITSMIKFKIRLLKYNLGI